MGVIDRHVRLDARGAVCFGERNHIACPPNASLRAGRPEYNANTHARLDSLPSFSGRAPVGVNRGLLPRASRGLGGHTCFAVSGVRAEDGATSSSDTASTEPFSLSYELVQGALVRWTHGAPGQHPPTAVLMHGILGSRRNLLSFAKRLAQAFPAWQFVLVDLRCHGQSADQRAPGENSVSAAAQDVLRLLGQLKIFPRALIGHSFGGKVAMSMLHQFGKRLPKQAQVWVLDTVPGDVFAEGGDHPRDVINFVQTIQMPLATRKELVDKLTGRGFTTAGAQWMTTNLSAREDGRLDWTFDIAGIAEMYKTYEATDLWPLVEEPPIGADIEFVRAEKSAFLWADEDVARITKAGARVHLLRDSGHWVHIDNPEGLVEIFKSRFGAGTPDGP